MTPQLSRLHAWISGLRGWRADLVALGLGALSALAFPPVFALPVLLVGFPGLLALLGSARGPAVAALRCWWFGFGLNLVGLYWVTEAILVRAAEFWWFVPIAVPALAALLSFFIAPVGALAWCAKPGWPRVFALAGGWVWSELARQFALGGFSWNPLGSVWEFPGRLGDVFIQPAAWVGVYGLTLLTVLLACAPMLRWAWRGGAAAVLVGWAALGLWRADWPVASPADPLSVVLVQGDVAEGEKWSQDLAIDIFRRYLALTEQGLEKAGPGPKVVIWPETAVPWLLAPSPQVRQAIMQATGGAPALVGAVDFTPEHRPLNELAALVGDDGTIAATYDKWHLVPFGEYQPPWARIGIQIVPGGGFVPGPGPETLNVPGVPPFAPFICYEAIFTHEIVNEMNRPRWMVNITNDAWFGNSTGPRQHLAAARLRTVEEGLPLMRAANTGISAGFDAHGHELGRLGLNQAGTLVLRLPGDLPQTLYARFGLAIPALMAGVLLAFGLVNFAWRTTRETVNNF